MTIPRSIGFPRMMIEAGERRVFLPDFIQFLTRLGLITYIEEGYGSRSGLLFHDYRQGNELVRQCTRQEAFEQDLVLVLRSPTSEEYRQVSPGNCLISMLHYPTRPKRVALLKGLDVNAISLDSIVDDHNLRLVENMKAVAWNGLEAAFDILEKIWPGLSRPDGLPIHTLVLGTGMVGKHAIEAATKLGNIERNNQHMREQGPGSLAVSIGRNLNQSTPTLRQLFSQSDILVDATQRRDPSKPVVPNEWLAWLPDHAIIADLAVDPYTPETDPPVVRGVEGIPQGNLDQYIFYPEDPNWEATLPPGTPSQHRRTVVTCYSWPGIHAEACMMHYGRQLEPLMVALVKNGYDGLSLDGEYFERALYRSSLHAWLKSGKYEPRPR